MTPDIALIIPAYCEEKRLPNYLPTLVSALADAPFQTTILIVDDGSPLDSYEALNRAISPRQAQNCTLNVPLRLSQNDGKGAAVLAGWAFVSAARWLAFVDADGAIPASDVRLLLEKALGGAADRCVIGTRLVNHNVKRTLARNIIGKLFRVVTALILARKVQDTQCGLKAIPQAAFADLQVLMTERGFAFDVNLLLAAEAVGLKTETLPVAFRDVGGGKINPVNDGFRMLCSVLRLRRAKNRWKKLRT
ncbi:MAG: glycosyltransferase [Chthoniobacterales bacterium]